VPAGNLYNSTASRALCTELLQMATILNLGEVERYGMWAVMAQPVLERPMNPMRIWAIDSRDFENQFR